MTCSKGEEINPGSQDKDSAAAQRPLPPLTNWAMHCPNMSIQFHIGHSGLNPQDSPVANLSAALSNIKSHQLVMTSPGHCPSSYYVFKVEYDSSC